MSEELKACPFCGNPFLILRGLMPHDEEFYHCDSCDYSISIVNGNTRPLEDALVAENAALIEKHKLFQDEVDKRLDEVEKKLAEYEGEDKR